MRRMRAMEARFWHEGGFGTVGERWDCRRWRARSRVEASIAIDR